MFEDYNWIELMGPHWIMLECYVFFHLGEVFFFLLEINEFLLPQQKKEDSKSGFFGFHH